MKRLALAGSFGLLAWALTVALATFGVVFNPGLWERVPASSLGWTLAYAAVFALGGVLCAWLGRVPVRALRHVLVGAVVGAVLWSYLTATWAFTARATAPFEPAAGVLEAAATGAALGALGGLLLYGLALLRPED